MRNRNIRVLSLFDGIGGAAEALKQLNIDCEYYGSEVDKYAIKVAQKNHPNIIHIGNVKEVNVTSNLLIYNFDLMIGGSPCQDLSAAGLGKGLEGERSGLFFEYVRILNEVKPKFFILENVASMKKSNCDKISQTLGIQPIMINSGLLTGQNRKRLYWVGELVSDKYEQILIQQPEDKNVSPVDILDYCNIDNRCFSTIGISNNRIFRKTEKASTLTASMFKGVRAAGRPIVCDREIIGQHIDSVDKSKYRLPTPTECERLQGFPDNYTLGISQTQRYKSLGNSFTVPVIKHIISTIFKN